MLRLVVLLGAEVSSHDVSSGKCSLVCLGQDVLIDK